MIAEQKLFGLSFPEQLEDDFFLAGIIALFLKDTYNDLVEMKQANDNGEPGLAAIITHKLKRNTELLRQMHYLPIWKK